MLISYANGQTSVVVRVKIRNSSVATGAGLTGLAYNSTGLIISTIADNESSPTTYTVAGSTIETITTLGTFATPTATKCRFKEVDSTNHKGVYEIQIDNARYAVSNAKSLLISILGATNAAECDVVIPLTVINPYASTVPADIQTIKTQTVTCGAGVTVGAYVGNATAALGVDASGRVDVGKILGTASQGAAGYVGFDWSKINAPTTTVNLSGTTISTSQAVASVSGAVGSVTGAVGSVTGNVGGNVVGSVGSISGVSFPSGFSSLTTSTIAAAVWDLTVSGHTTSGTFGAAMNAAGSAGDPWSTSLPGSYGSGTAGYILGNAVSTAAGIRTAIGLASANLDTQLSTIAGYIDTEVAAIYSRIGAPAGASIAADIAAIKSETAAILDDTGTSGVVVASASKTGYSLASSGLDAIVIETGLNARQALAINAAALAGVLSGAATTTVTVKGAGVATTRITATVDADGNRSAVTLALPS